MPPFPAPEHAGAASPNCQEQKYPAMLKQRDVVVNVVDSIEQWCALQGIGTKNRKANNKTIILQPYSPQDKHYSTFGVNTCVK